MQDKQGCRATDDGLTALDQLLADGMGTAKLIKLGLIVVIGRSCQVGTGPLNRYLAKLGSVEPLQTPYAIICLS